MLPLVFSFIRSGIIFLFSQSVWKILASILTPLATASRRRRSSPLVEFSPALKAASKITPPRSTSVRARERASCSSSPCRPLPSAGPRQMVQPAPINSAGLNGLERLILICPIFVSLSLFRIVAKGLSPFSKSTYIIHPNLILSRSLGKNGLK